MRQFINIQILGIIINRTGHIQCFIIQEHTLLLFPLEALETEPTHLFQHILFLVKLNLTLESGGHAAKHTLDFALVWIVLSHPARHSDMYCTVCTVKGPAVVMHTIHAELLRP